MTYSMLTAPVRVLCADAPWKFGDSLPGETRGASKNYATLDVRDLVRFPLPPLAENGILFFWRVASMQEEALRVIDAWGFTLKTEIVWIKRTSAAPEAPLAFGMGHYTRASHETCLVATRGRFKVSDRAVRSIFDTLELDAPLGDHSAKPASFYALVERLCFPPDEERTHANGPVELFGRTPRPGWHVFGNEVGPEKLAHAWTPYVVPVSQEPAAVAARAENAEKRTKAKTPTEDTAASDAAIAKHVLSGDPAPPIPDAVVTLPDHVADDLGEHPALTDPVLRERIVLRALTLNLITSAEVHRGVDSAFAIALKRGAEQGIRLTEHGIASQGEAKAAEVALSASEIENIAALATALSVRMPTVPIVLGDVAKWPVASRTQARAWLLGNGEPPPEVIALAQTATSTPPPGAHVLDGETQHEVLPSISAEDAMAAMGVAPTEKKKRGRPKKQKPCSGCGTLCDEALCASCKARLGGPGMPAVPAATVVTETPVATTVDPWMLAAARAEEALREDHEAEGNRQG